MKWRDAPVGGFLFVSFGSEGLVVLLEEQGEGMYVGVAQYTRGSSGRGWTVSVVCNLSRGFTAIANKRILSRAGDSLVLLAPQCVAYPRKLWDVQACCCSWRGQHTKQGIQLLRRPIGKLSFSALRQGWITQSSSQ